MTDLYIANCTAQQQVICFRMDFTPKGEKIDFKPHTQREIRAGQQVCIRDLHIEQAETIRQQLEPFGLLSVSEISRAKGVTPLIFNVDKQVKADQIRAVINHNTGVLIIRGKVRRQNAAMSIYDIVNNTVAKQLAEQQMPVPEEPTDLDVEFEQVEQSEAGERRIEEGLRVSATATPTKPRGKPGPKGPRLKRT